MRAALYEKKTFVIFRFSSGRVCNSTTLKNGKPTTCEFRRRRTKKKINLKKKKNRNIIIIVCSLVA